MSSSTRPDDSSSEVEVEQTESLASWAEAQSFTKVKSSEVVTSTIDVRAGGSHSVNVHLMPNKTETRLNAAAGLIIGDQADGYNIGDLVFVKHLGWPWPARVEDPSNVLDTVTRFQYAVFLYGVHERKVVKLRDMYLYEANAEKFEANTEHFILNAARREAKVNLDVNLERIPAHKKLPIRYLRKSYSHTKLEKYLQSNNLNMVQETSEGDVATIYSTEEGEGQFMSTPCLTSSDSTLGYCAIVSSVLFMAYMTWWLILLPFLDDNYHGLVDDYFPLPSHSLVYPIAAGTVLVSSIVAAFGAIAYGPRVYAQPWVVSSPRKADTPVEEKHRRLKELIEMIEKRRPAMFILVTVALLFYSPCKVFAAVVVVFGSVHLVYNFLVCL